MHIRSHHIEEILDNLYTCYLPSCLPFVICVIFWRHLHLHYHIDQGRHHKISTFVPRQNPCFFWEILLHVAWFVFRRCTSEPSLCFIIDIAQEIKSLAGECHRVSTPNHLPLQEMGHFGICSTGDLVLVPCCWLPTHERYIHQAVSFASVSCSSSANNTFHSSNTIHCERHTFQFFCCMISQVFCSTYIM